VERGFKKTPIVFLLSMIHFFFSLFPLYLTILYLNSKVCMMLSIINYYMLHPAAHALLET